MHSNTDSGEAAALRCKRELDDLNATVLCYLPLSLHSGPPYPTPISEIGEEVCRLALALFFSFSYRRGSFSKICFLFGEFGEPLLDG